MNKNIIIKSIAALTILTSITGVGTTMVEGIQQTAEAKILLNKLQIQMLHHTVVLHGWALEQDLSLEIIQSLPMIILSHESR